MDKTGGWIATGLWTGGLAFLVTVVAGGIWTSLLLANLASTPAVPWAAAAMAPVLWSIWSYLGGKWPPGRAKEAGAVFCEPGEYRLQCSPGRCLPVHGPWSLWPVSGSSCFG